MPQISRVCVPDIILSADLGYRELGPRFPKKPNLQTSPPKKKIPSFDGTLEMTIQEIGIERQALRNERGENKGDFKGSRVFPCNEAFVCTPSALFFGLKAYIDIVGVSGGGDQLNIG